MYKVGRSRTPQGVRGLKQPAGFIVVRQVGSQGVRGLKKKKLSELVWSRELFCSIILLSCQEEE